MEIANKVANAVVKAVNSDAMIDTCLIYSFAALWVRSVKQQNEIEALESQKESLVKANKAMKKTMWDWKQKLFGESSATESALVRLARLESIYGANENTKSLPTKLVI